MDWTQLLRELRDAGLTQESIASRTGIKQATVSDLYTGRTKNPSFETGEKLKKLHARRSRKQEAKEI